jgi:hypothetical protein
MEASMNEQQPRTIAGNGLEGFVWGLVLSLTQLPETEPTVKEIMDEVHVLVLETETEAVKLAARELEKN